MIQARKKSHFSIFAVWQAVSQRIRPSLCSKTAGYTHTHIWYPMFCTPPFGASCFFVSPDKNPGKLGFPPAKPRRRNSEALSKELRPEDSADTKGSNFELFLAASVRFFGAPDFELVANWNKGSWGGAISGFVCRGTLRKWEMGGQNSQPVDPGDFVHARCFDHAWELVRPIFPKRETTTGRPGTTRTGEWAPFFLAASGKTRPSCLHMANIDPRIKDSCETRTPLFSCLEK